jgi:protein gp37
MGEKTEIAWTEKTYNPWQGCTKMSPGCAHCYMFRDKRRYGQDPLVVVRSKDPTFYAPLRWREPALVFTCSWSDFFHAAADEWRDDAWDVIRRTPHLTYQILTKRQDRILQCLPPDWGPVGWPNVWLGVSVENQHFADIRIPALLQVPARVRFLSCEPLLGPVDLFAATSLPGDDDYIWDEVNGWDDREPEMHVPECEAEHDWINFGNRLVLNPEWQEWEEERERYARFLHFKQGIGWVITGGESGPDGERREMRPEWARRLRDQCVEAGVPFFFKQSSGPRPGMNPLLDGVEWKEFPGVAARGAA